MPAITGSRHASRFSRGKPLDKQCDSQRSAAGDGWLFSLPCKKRCNSCSACTVWQLVHRTDSPPIPVHVNVWVSQQLRSYMVAGVVYSNQPHPAY
jgi:hypothetical protein